MPLDYEDAKQVFAAKLYNDGSGKGRFDAALLATCEFVYIQGIQDGAPAKENHHMKYYAVFGRIPGADEDSCYTCQALNSDQAFEHFRRSIYEEVGVETPGAVVLTYIVTSDTPIDIEWKN